VVTQIETEAAARRARTGSKPLGVAAILGKHPHHRPVRLKKSPAPLFHAIRQSLRQGLYEGYAWFVAAFRQAAEKLKAGDRSAAFPRRVFPVSASVRGRIVSQPSQAAHRLTKARSSSSLESVYPGGRFS